MDGLDLFSVEVLAECLVLILPAMALAIIVTFLLCEARLTTVKTTVAVLERQIKEARVVKEDEEKMLREIFSTLVSLQTNTEQILGHIKIELDELTGQVRLYGSMIQSGNPLVDGATEGRVK